MTAPRRRRRRAPRPAHLPPADRDAFFLYPPPSEHQRAWLRQPDYAVLLQPPAPQPPRLYASGLDLDEAEALAARARRLGRAQVLPAAEARRRCPC